MAKYIQKVHDMDNYFLEFEVRNIRCMENKEADSLAKAAVGQRPLPQDELHETLWAAAIAEGVPVCTIKALTIEDWCSPICPFIEGCYVTDNCIEEQRLQHHCRGYMIVEGILYKGGVRAASLVSRQVQGATAAERDS